MYDCLIHHSKIDYYFTWFFITVYCMKQVNENHSFLAQELHVTHHLAILLNSSKVLKVIYLVKCSNRIMGITIEV